VTNTVGGLVGGVVGGLTGGALGGKNDPDNGGPLKGLFGGGRKGH
jgi:hypothetical protein